MPSTRTPTCRPRWARTPRRSSRRRPAPSSVSSGRTWATGQVPAGIVTSRRTARTMTADDLSLRRLVAVVIGLLGMMFLLDVLIIAVVVDHPDFSGSRWIFALIIGALL